MFSWLFKAIMRLLYSGFDCTGYSRKGLLVTVLFQKIFRVNANVPWPVHWSSRVKAPEKIIRGTETPGSMPCCHIDGRNGIILENNVIIGPNVSIISQNHDVLEFDSYINEKPIKIGANSWLGAGCIILPGVELGEHTIVGAGAIVSRSFPDCDQILAGNPAKIIKKIEPYRIRQ